MILDASSQNTSFVDENDVEQKSMRDQKKSNNQVSEWITSRKRKQNPKKDQSMMIRSRKPGSLLASLVKTNATKKVEALNRFELSELSANEAEISRKTKQIIENVSMNDDDEKDINLLHGVTAEDLAWTSEEDIC